MEAESLRIRAEIAALNLTVAALIQSFPDHQQARVLKLMGSLTKATNLYNTELLAFSVGQEATYQIQNALNGLGRTVFSLDGLYRKAEQNPSR